MEDSEKWLSPLKSTSPKPSFTGENDENDSSQDKVIPKFQNPKKTNAKHFMSPTISASSKAAHPKKKILSERNENSSNADVQNHKTSNLDKKTSPRNSSISHSYRPSPRTISSYDRASELDDNCHTDFLNNSSVKAYDPLRNYLSPRPKYLRFNPNRRSEIFNRLEKKEFNDSFDSEEVIDSSFSPPKENVGKPENEENNLEGDDKNISNDYEEEEEDEEEVEEEERGWCFRGVLKFVITLIACVLSTSYICTMNSASPTPTQQFIWKVKDGCLMIKRQTLEVVGTKMHEAGFLKVEVGDDYGEFEEADYNGENEESFEVEIIEDNVENLAEEVEIYEDKNREIEESVKFQVIENDVENLERVEVEIIEDGVENLDEVETNNEENREIKEVVKVEIFENDVGNLEKVDNELVENESEISKDKLNEDSVEKTETAESEIKSAKTDEIENIGKYELEMEIKGSHENSTNSGDEVENEKVGRKTSDIILVFVVSIVLASLAIFLYRLKKKPRSALAGKSEPVLKPHCGIHSIKEAPPKELEHNNHICAPTVELIGEIVVGKVSSRRVRKYEAESEEGNAAFFPKNNTLAQPVLAPTQLHMPEYSNISSRSYGSFATETKIFKKEGGGQSGECTMEDTPVRRSSRLRSRAAVTSP